MKTDSDMQKNTHLSDKTQWSPTMQCDLRCARDNLYSSIRKKDSLLHPLLTLAAFHVQVSNYGNK